MLILYELLNKLQQQKQIRVVQLIPKLLVTRMLRKSATRTVLIEILESRERIHQE